ncbi:hypothetical protein AYI96_17490 [Shewanella sp. MSW]|nr:hypothetical protein AYI96_17490 [Shewanella sp. MSW]GHB15398.1 hypothetical protein GCM10007107_30410 [Shewanella indica]
MMNLQIESLGLPVNGAWIPLATLELTCPAAKIQGGEAKKAPAMALFSVNVSQSSVNSASMTEPLG